MKRAWSQTQTGTFDGIKGCREIKILVSSGPLIGTIKFERPIYGIMGHRLEFFFAQGFKVLTKVGALSQNVFALLNSSVLSGYHQQPSFFSQPDDPLLSSSITEPRTTAIAYLVGANVDDQYKLTLPITPQPTSFDHPVSLNYIDWSITPMDQTNYTIFTSEVHRVNFVLTLYQNLDIYRGAATTERLGENVTDMIKVDGFNTY